MKSTKLHGYSYADAPGSTVRVSLSHWKACIGFTVQDTPSGLTDVSRCPKCRSPMKKFCRDCLAGGTPNSSRDSHQVEGHMRWHPSCGSSATARTTYFP